MIIKSVRAKHFRSILDESLPCGALRALVGRNGSGKSSFLSALELFYDPSPRVVDDDFYANDTSEDIEITVTFSELTSEETDLFSAYIDSGTLSIARVFSAATGRISGVYHGILLQNPEFAPIRDTEQLRERTRRYNEIRDSAKYSTLPSVRAAADAVAALEQWEAEHPDECMPMRDAGQFFGFAGAGRGYLGRYTKFIRVRAVRDASDDAADGRGSCITEIMDLVVRSVLEVREDVTSFKTDTAATYRNLFDPDNLTELRELQAELTGTLSQYVPAASVSLQWSTLAEVHLPMPNAQVRLLEDARRRLRICRGTHWPWPPTSLHPDHAAASRGCEGAQNCRGIGYSIRRCSRGRPSLPPTEPCTGHRRARTLPAPQSPKTSVHGAHAACAGLDSKRR